MILILLDHAAIRNQLRGAVTSCLFGLISAAPQTTVRDLLLIITALMTRSQRTFYLTVTLTINAFSVFLVSQLSKIILNQDSFYALVVTLTCD